MKIISKHKDYYDYLMGIYGVDERIPLERPSLYRYDSPKDYHKIAIFVADTLYEGVYYDGKYRYGDDIIKTVPDCYDNTTTEKNWQVYYSVTRSYGLQTHKNGSSLEIQPGNFVVYRYQYNTWRNRSIRMTTNPIKFPEHMSPNVILKCPILVMCMSGEHSMEDCEIQRYNEFPDLGSFDLPSVLPAHDIWVMLSEWIARERYKEGKTDILDNTQKILSHGFDKKTSFRGKIK